MKNTIKATIYIIAGATVSVATTLLIVAMYTSSTFLPVYIAGKYVLGNQIIRYTLYAILIAVDFAGINLFLYAMGFLVKRFRRRIRRNS